MTEAGDGRDPQPEGSQPEGADVPSFGNVSEVEISLSPTQGGSFRVRGSGTPGRLARIVMAPAFCLLGVVAAVVLLLANHALWQPAAVLVVCLAIAAACLRIS